MKAKLIKSEDSYILKDGLFHVLGIDDKKLKDRLECPYLLSKQNCDSLFGVVDVDKLAREDYKGISFKTKEESFKTKTAYIKGFNKAMELNKDKVFTLEDVINAISFGQGMDLWKEEEQIDKFIQSLQQPTEIEVEIEMFTPGATYGHSGWHEEPKLDSEGCLILKKI